ncbi:MAG: rhamnogalacturonan acetylesterase [Marinilabiliaceae bacterium]|nr:rhamnogalacturonan acetylesterase [Marinilabiliaceae bacterium]
MKRLIFLLPILLLFTSLTESSKPTIFMIGDSTMANKKASNFPETGWGEALYAYTDTSKIQIENHARNGRSTKSFIDEGLWKVVIDKIKPGDFLFIQFGHNDEKINKPKVYARAETTYKLNLERFIDECRTKGATPILFTSIVRRHFLDNGLLEYTHGKYPAIVKQIGTEKNVTVIDMEAKTKLLVERFGIEESKKLYMNLDSLEYPNHRKGKEDNTHLTRKGAIIIAGEAVDCIKKQIPELRIFF